MLFSEFKTLRLAQLLQEEWGRVRIPDLLEVYRITRPRSVIEIGCYQGVSTEFWALHCQRVVAIDPWPDLLVRRQFQARVGHYPHIQMVEGYSPSAVGSIIEQFDMAYIDGDHEYHAVKNDIAAVRPLLPDGAWIAGHDYGSCPGVQQAVDEVLGRPSHRFSDGSWALQVDFVSKA